tara:strand:+ start:370 stop:1008 length:639 start_codon:yes stop_codon:yes gene_type:complete
MNIQEKLDSLQPHVIGIRYFKGLQIVDAVFKTGWVVPESNTIKKELVDEKQNYYMFYTEKKGITIDNLLDYVEEIILMNVERENKQLLLKEKFKELQVLFKDNPLSKLSKLRFTFNEYEQSIMDFDLTEKDDPPVLNNHAVNKVETTIKSSKKVTPKMVGKVANLNTKKIEFPPKKDKKIKLEEFKPPKNIKCKCDPNDVCPLCEEQKIGAY